MSRSVLWSVVGVVVVIAAVVAVVILVPGNNNSNNTTNRTTGSSNTLTDAQKQAASAKIKSNVQTFFAADTPMATRVSLLQNGEQFAQPMQAEFSQLASQKPSVTINSITFPNKTTAKVNYTVLLNNQPVLQNQTGEALYLNNNWLISDATLCQLLRMGGTAPAVCNGIQ